MLLSGWLTKKGSANAFSSGNTWRRRYFSLCAAAAPNTGAVLRYFNADGEKNPRGEAPILAISVVRVLDTEATLVEHGLKARPYTASLLTST